MALDDTSPAERLQTVPRMQNFDTAVGASPIIGEPVGFATPPPLIAAGPSGVTPDVQTIPRRAPEYTLEEENAKVVEFEAFRRYQLMKRKEAEKGKTVEDVANDSSDVSLRSCDSKDSDDEQVSRIELHQELGGKPRKQRRSNKGGVAVVAKKKKTLVPAEVKEAQKYNKAFEGSSFKSPFTDEINETPIPKGLKGPRVKMYDGTGDPDDHVSNFQWAIKMIPMDPKLWNLYFAGTLDGSARYWLASLPPKSIRRFDELCNKFCNSFIQQRRYQQQAHAIFACRQREGESNKAYFKRFNELSRKMPTRDDPMIIAAFTYGLVEGNFFANLWGKTSSRQKK